MIDPEDSYIDIGGVSFELEETEIYEPKLKTINTELITDHTVLVCPKCGGRNRLKDKSCVKCDRHLV